MHSMRPEEIVSFLVHRGRHVVRTASCWWFEDQWQSRIYHSFPSHRLIAPSQAEIGELFRQLPSALGVRFLESVQPDRRQSFIWVRRRPYDLHVLSAKSRNQTRRGTEDCEVRKLSWEELIASAQEAHTDTINRHKAPRAQSLGFDVGLEQCPAYEGWGALVNGRLAAYAVTLTVEDWVHILLQRSVTAHLKSRPNNALIFCLVREALGRENISTVSYGLEPLSSLESLEHFKLGMGFIKEPVRQRIVVAPRVKLVLNPITAKPLSALADLLPKNPRLQKIAGFCRFAQNR